MSLNHRFICSILFSLTERFHPRLGLTIKSPFLNEKDGYDETLYIVRAMLIN